MRKIIWLVLLFIFLSDCSEIRFAKANEIREKTNRDNEWHVLEIEEEEEKLRIIKALRAARIKAAENLLWAIMTSGIVLIVVLAGSGSYYVIGISIAKVRQADLMFVPLDKTTRQYPMVISHGNRAYLPGTGERAPLDEDQIPYPQLVSGSHAVQLTGVRFSSYQEYEEQTLIEGR